MNGLGGRVLVALAAMIFVVGSVAGPSPALAADPQATATPAVASAPPVTSDASDVPAATPAPTPAPAATPAPTASPAPSATPAPDTAPADDTGFKAGATEIVAARTEYSQSFDNHDGTQTTQLYAAPVFYKPEGSNVFEPIDVGFMPAAEAAGFVSDKAPVAVGVTTSSSTGDFLSTTYEGRTISFRMPAAVAKAAGSVDPAVDGAVADYAGIAPGIDLRVIANAHGAKSFFVWRTAPTDPSISYVIDADGLVLMPQGDGSIAMVDELGSTVARIPSPYAVDSTPDEHAGGGRFTDAVRLSLGKDGRTVTLTVDPAWLKTAVYPVYVDPSTGWVYNAGSNSYGDAHTASGYPTHNYDDYQRPDSPYYHELWNGTDPSGTSGTSYDFLRWNLASYANVTVDSASLRLYPYHQYYNSPTTETTYVRRVTGSWTETGLTWNNQPGYTTSGDDSAGCVEGALCVWDVKAIVQAWLKGISPSSNYGFQVDTIGKNSTFWKRFIASEQGGSNRPALTITYHNAAVTSTTPALSRAVSWTYADSGGAAQTIYHVDVAATQAGLGSANLATSGDVSSAATAWAVTPTTPGTMTDGASYWYQVRAYNGSSWTAWAQGQFTYDAYARGAEGFYSAAGFDLGGGWNLDVAVHNGEARLSRSLYSLPAYGPSQGLDVTYDSLDTATAGMLGYGWSSNLTQTIWQNSPTNPTLVLWNRPDAARVAFTGSGTSWTAVPGHFETLSYNGTTEYTVTEPDQTRLVFTAATGRLARIVDRFGKTLTFTWGATSATVVHSCTAQVTTLNYPGGSLITSVVDPAGRTWALGYTGSDLTSITEPDPDAGGPLAAPATTLGYGSHLLGSVTRSRRTAAGTTDTLVWDITYTAGRVTGVADAIAHASFGGVASTITYNASSTDVARLRTYSPATRDTTTYAFDAFGRVTSQTDPNGYLTTWSWNTPASTVAYRDEPVDGSSSTRTAYTYDAAGNVLTETADALGSPVTTRYVYNATNDVLIRSDADNDAAAKVITKYAYDAGGHVTSVVTNCTSAGTTPPADAATCTGGGTADAQTNLLTQYHYASNDLVDAARDPGGITTTHAYDSLGNETTVVVNCTGGASWDTCTASGTHDATTNVTSVSAYALGTTTGKLGLADSITNPLTGRSTTFTYDLLGRPLTEVAPEGPTSREWDQLGNEIRTTAPGSVVTTATFDLDNRMTSEVTPPASTTTAFDAAGNVLTLTISGDTRTRTFDGAGNLLSETIDPGAAPHLNLTTQHAYDAAGREVASRNPAGTVMRTIYDALGRRTKTVENCTNTGTTVPDASSWASCAGTGTKDATWNVTTTYGYDGRGNLVSETATNGRLTTRAYDDLDRLVKVVDNDVATPALPTDDVTTEYAYDAASNEVAVKSPTATGGTAGYRVTRSFYDALGRVTKTIENCTNTGTTVPDATSWPTCAGTGTKNAATNVEVTSSYDADGNLLSTTEPSPAATSGSDLTTTTTRYAYDGASRLCRVLEAASVDLQGLVNPCTDVVSGTATTNVSTRYTYDGRGFLATMVDGRGGTTAYGYDDRGRMTSLAEPGIATPTTWTYTDNPDGTSVKTLTNRNGSTVVWTYDAAGRLASRAYQDETGAARSTAYGYDAAGAVVSAVDGTNAISMTNDRLRRPTQVSVTGDPTATTTDVYSFTAPSRTNASGAYAMTLDKLGHLTSLTDPVHGTAFTFTYGAAGQLTGTTAPNGNATSIGYDNIGRELTRTTGTRAAYVLVYNRAGLRLTEASTITGDPGNGTATTGYDALGRLTSYGLPGVRTQSAGWQAVPNRDTQTIDGVGSSLGFDAANRPNTGGYAFDTDGRMTARPGSTGGALEWDSLGRLVRVRTTPGGTLVATYGYDALDRLRTVARPGQPTLRFRYSGLSNSVAQVVDDSTGTAIRNVAYGPDGTVLEDWLGASRRIYGANGHRDTTWTADDTGAVTATLRFDPWGGLLRSSGTLPDWRFQGSWLDTATNLEWSVARWYDPVTASFISADAQLGDPARPASRHRFAYGEGDPVNAWDPSGSRRVALNFNAIPPRGQGTLKTNSIKQTNTCKTGFWVNCGKTKTATLYAVAVEYKGVDASRSGWKGIITNVKFSTLEWSHIDESLNAAAAYYYFEARLSIRAYHPGDGSARILAARNVVTDTRACVPIYDGPVWPAWPEFCQGHFGGSRNGRSYEVSYYAPRGVRTGDYIQVMFQQRLTVAGGGFWVGSLGNSARGSGLSGTLTLD